MLVSLDNVGIWDVRTENLDDWYLGQEVYVKVADPEGYNKTEMLAPDNILYCGLLKDKQKYVEIKITLSSTPILFHVHFFSLYNNMLLTMFFVSIFLFVHGIQF